MSYKKKQQVPNVVNEPMVQYQTNGLNSFTRLLGGIKLATLTSDFDIINLTRNGLPKNVLLSFAKKISITLQELADIMHISERTFQRYEDNSIVKTEYAEKAVELARLYTRGEEVFGSMDKFKLWMKTPGYVFNNETPLSLLDTSVGFNVVLKELGRIEYGVFA